MLSLYKDELFSEQRDLRSEFELYCIYWQTPDFVTDNLRLAFKQYINNKNELLEPEDELNDDTY